MEQLVGIYRIVRLPGVDEEDFEKYVKEEVFQSVNKIYTRGGGITRLSFLKDYSGDREDRYLWVIEWETFGGSWFDEHLAGALEKLKSVGIPVSFSTFRQLEMWSQAR